MAAIQEPSSDENIKIIKQVYFGINQYDLDSVLSLLDADVVRVEPKELTGGTYRGHVEMRNHIISGRSTWAEGAIEPVEFFSNENKIVVIVHIKVRLKNDPKWLDAQLADGFSLKGGLVTEFHSFMNRQSAFEWAGLSF